jgi:hypothetical protein
VAASHLSAPFITHLLSSRLQTARPSLEALVAADQPPSVQSLADRLATLQRLPGSLHDLASIRLQWARSPEAVYLAEPNILSRHSLVDGDVGGSIRLVQAIDIVANPVEVKPIAGLNPTLVRLEQGVLDSLAERAVLGASAVTAETSVGGVDSASRWVPVRTSQDLDRVRLDPDARARVAHELRSGYIALVPEEQTSVASQPAPWSFWRIDPVTGNAISMGDRGWGQAMVEKIGLSVAVGATSGLICALITSLDGELSTWDMVTCTLAGITAGGGFGYFLVTTASPSSGMVVGAIYLAFFGGALAGAGRQS